MALRFASVLLFTVCAVGFGVAIPAAPPSAQCGQNAERRTCGTACAPTCSNPTPGPICVLPCVDACFCKEGYLKAANGQCVRPDECESVPHIPMQIPQLNQFVAEEPKCGADEEYRQCGPSCVPTCAMPLPKPWCSLRCFPGCYCKEGFVKNEEGKCIPATKCKLPESTGPINIPLQKVPLKKPEGTGSVNIPLQKVPLKKPEGTGSVNIPLQKVPLKKPEGTGPINIPLQKIPLQPLCPKENEEYHTCGVQLDCLASCKIPSTPKCRERMCTPGCVCRKPFVRNEEGRCVEKTQCPKMD